MDERKVATVLFADLVGSTALADSQDPERTRALLDRFYDAMAAEVTAAGGTVEKFAGDAVMAAFGAPAAYEDHAERALHAALSMHWRLDALFAGELKLRIGVNTGEVVVGRPRQGSSFVSGDAVNIAARLEQAASPGEALVGERTVAAARGAFEFDEPITVEAKGKPDGIACRRLVRALTLMRPRGVHGLREAFVGREAELQHLLTAYRGTVESGRPRLVTLIGDAGVGKTRLIRELWARLPDERPEPLRLTGRCLAYGRAITYWPLGEILRERLGILESDPPADVERRLGDRRILGLTLGLDTADELHPLAARDALHEAWIAFFDSLVAERPTVALIEDVHWAEPPLLDLVERLVRDVAGPLLLMATARPDFVDARAGWGAGRYDAETIWLDPLPSDAAGGMLVSLLGVDLPDSTRDLIVHRAEGNPLFIEELLGSLIDRGTIERSDGAWQVRDLEAGVEIPDTVQAVVAARLDLLQPAEKAALQAASVVGRVFWTGPVYDLIEAEPDLRVLEDRDFIRRRGGSSLEGEREFAFKHAITREVAYESVPRARRARLHAAFAGWIEDRIGDRDEMASMLAHHYAAAVNPDVADLAWGGEPEQLQALTGRARRWLRRAADLALTRYELDDCVTLLEQALQLGPDRSEELQLWRALGQVHAIRYDGMGMWRGMQRAIDLCEDRTLLGELYAELSVETATRWGMWSHVPDFAMVQGWIDRALELSEPGTAARARALSALCFWQPERPSWAVDELDELTLRLGDPWLRILALNSAWLRSFARGKYPEGLEIARRALSLEGGTSDPNVSAEVRESSLALFVLCGTPDETRQLLTEHEHAVERLSAHHRLHGVALWLEFYEVTAEWEALRLLVPRTRSAVADNLSTPCVRNARSLILCAAACAALGDHKEARSLEHEADSVQPEGYDLVLQGPKVRLALAKRDFDAVRELTAEPNIERRQMWIYPGAVVSYLDALVALGDRERAERDAPPFLGSRSVLEPFAIRTLGVVRDDRTLVEEAATMFERMGFEQQAENTRVARLGPTLA